MGGGGVSGKIGFPAYIEALHQGWLIGSNPPTSSGAQLKPDGVSMSLLDVMEAALASAGSPYTMAKRESTDGKYYTDPATDLGTVQTRYNTYNSVVTGLAETTDWSAHVDAAKAKAAEANVIERVVASTLRSNAQTYARQHVMEALGLRNVGNTPRTDYSTFVAQLKAEIANSLSGTVDEATILTSMKTDADTLFDGAQDQVDITRDHVTKWEAIFESVLAKTYKLSPANIASIIGAVRSGATAEITAALASVNTGLAEETDWQSIIDVAAAKIAALRSAEGISDLNLATIATNAVTRTDTEIDAAVGKKSTGITEATDVPSWLGAAVTKVDEADVLVPITFDTSHEAAKVGADEEVDAAVGKKSSGLVENTLVEGMFDAAKAKVDAVGALTTIDEATITTDAVTAAGTEMLAAKAAKSTGLTETTDWAALITQAVSSVDTDGVLSTIDISTIVSAARSGASSELTAAIQAAVGAIDEAVIAAQVEAFRVEADKQRVRAIRQFSGQMADINAVNSSAFLFGFAVIQADHIAQVDRFQAELRKGVFDAAMQAHVDLYKADLAARLQAAVQDKVSRETLLREGAQLMANMYQVRAEYEKAIITLHERAWEFRIQAGIQADTTNKQSREAVLLRLVEAMMSGLGIRAEYEKFLIGTHERAWEAHLQGGLQTEIQNKQSREQVMLAMLDAMQRTLAVRAQYEMAKIAAHMQAYREQVIADLRGAEVNKASNEGLIVGAVESMQNLLMNRTRMEEAFMQLHVEAYKSLLTAHTAGALADKNAKDNLIISQADVAMRKAVADNQYYTDTIRSYLEAHRSVGTVHMQGALAELDSRDKHMLQGLGAMVGMLQNKTDMEKAVLSLYASTLAQNLELETRAAVVNAGAYNTFIPTGAQVMAGMLQNKVEQQRLATDLQTEITRMKVVATHEYEAADVDLERAASLWDLEIIERGAALLAAPGHPAQPIPRGPSKAASALSGALSGAGRGAMIGSAIPGGTAIGAGIGAILGAGAGLFS